MSEFHANKTYLSVFSTIDVGIYVDSESPDASGRSLYDQGQVKVIADTGLKAEN